jgi:hypothetical protein
MSKSTGRRTPKGKARASQEEATYWAECGRILPAEQEEAAILRDGFMADPKPEGAIEQEVIDDLVLNRLIKRRIDVAFTREFAKARAQKTKEGLDKQDDSAIQFWFPSRGRRGRDREQLRPDLCAEGLENLRNQIRDHGPHLEHLFKLQRIYGDKPTEHAAIAMEWLTLIVSGKQNTEGSTEANEQEELTKSILEALEIEIGLQKLRLEVAQNLDAIDFASDVQEPRGPILDGLLRYRAANTREFKDLLGTRDRIRRLRKGAA